MKMVKLSDFASFGDLCKWLDAEGILYDRQDLFEHFDTMRNTRTNTHPVDFKINKDSRTGRIALYHLRGHR